MARRPNPSAKKSSLSQFGLIDIPDLETPEDDAMDMSDDDIDLEAELAAISGSGGARNRPKKKVEPATNLDAMIAASLKDVPSDDDAGSGDEDDPDLLSELQELTVEDSDAPPPVPQRTTRSAPPPPGEQNSTVSLLQERISNYVTAEANAKANGETSRARRFARGLKTLNDLLKQAKAGRPISEEDVPPPVSTGRKSPPPPSQPPPDLVTPAEEPPVPEERPPAPEERSDAPASDVPPEKAAGLQVILKRKEEFKVAALASKQTGDKPLALELLKVVKQFDMVVDAYKAGEEMDLSELPTPEAITAAFKSQQRGEEARQESVAEPSPAPAVSGEAGLITASSVEEALKQRLAVYEEQEANAKQQGNSSKQRRMGRIVKQYRDAIKLHAAGRPVPVDELPTPPGFAPIPTGAGSTTRPAPAAPRPAPATPRPAPADARPASARGGQATRADKQLAFLLLRQKEFKEAALEAKRNGNIAQAKEYLRAAKGFDSVLDAARGGLAVDLKSLPLPPGAKTQLENTFDVVSAEDCEPPDDTGPLIDLDDEDVLTRLHSQLSSQLKLCLANRDHYQAMGNVAEKNRFEHLAVSVKQDLDLVTVAKRRSQDPPKFHYESRQFSVVQCNTDLNENDLELTIVRGIAYTVPNPKEIDTYVKFEFPYPQDAPVTDRTALVKDTNSPAYNAVFPLLINRAERPCQRLFRRHGIKFEVYSRGGWFSKDQLLGSATVKLAPLETQVTLHDSFQLMDGRRPAGGSLEVKLRVRTPLAQQQFVNTTHRWLVIDN